MFLEDYLTLSLRVYALLPVFMQYHLTPCVFMQYFLTLSMRVYVLPASMSRRRRQIKTTVPLSIVIIIIIQTEKSFRFFLSNVWLSRKTISHFCPLKDMTNLATYVSWHSGNLFKYQQERRVIFSLVNFKKNKKTIWRAFGRLFVTPWFHVQLYICKVGCTGVHSSRFRGTCRY